MAQYYRRPLNGFELLEQRHLLATYFVDPVVGTDLQATGSIDQPFKTITRASLFAQPGDTVALRAGVYREQVNLIRSGSEGNPITFMAYNNEDVLITTTEPLSGWVQHSGDIYKATFDSSIMGRNNMTLFVDGQPMTEAHWSDFSGNIDTLDSSQWSTMTSASRTTITDTSLRQMTAGLWNDAFVYAQTSDFTVETRRIVDFQSGALSGNITLERPFDRNPRSGDRYLIFNSLAALDAPGEWYFDALSDTLYLWAPQGGSPDQYAVEVKHRREAFNLNGHDYIHIQNINMRGGDLDMSGSNHILLQGATIQLPDYGFGPEGSGGARSLIVDGSHNVIRDNEFDRVHATAIWLAGSNNQIVNNYFHDIGFNNVNGAAVNLRPGSADNLVSHNTITRVGRAAIGGSTLRAVIQHNDFSEIGLTTSDVGAIYFANNSLGNSEIHHNVFRNIIGHKVTGVYADNRTSDLIVHHNLMYNLSPWGGKINLPTSFMLWYNNTIYNSGIVDAWAPAGSSRSSLGSKFFNNIVASLDPDFFSTPDKAEASNNLLSTSSSHFVDAASGDFRLASGSAAIDAGRHIPGITDNFSGQAPDIGALQFGEPMFAFGHDFSNPPFPTYDWKPHLFSSFDVNGDFEMGLHGWTVDSGAPQTVFGNAWNYRGEGLATSGQYGLALQTGDRVSQTFTGLLPNTTYIARANARLIGAEIQVEDYDDSFGAIAIESIRQETGVTNLKSGNWLRFDNVDFGVDQPLHDRIELGVTKTSAVNIEVRLNNPTTGPLLTTIHVGAHGEPWFMEGADIAAVTGTHSLYLVFQGNAGNGVFDRIRLLDTEPQEAVLFGAEGFDHLGTVELTAISSAYWGEATPWFEFTTGPNATSTRVYLEKSSGNLTGYVDLFTITTSTNQPPPLIPGDFNGDRQVDGEDLIIWESHFGQPDNVLDGSDFLTWQRNYGVSQVTAFTDTTTVDGSFDSVDELSVQSPQPEHADTAPVMQSLVLPQSVDTVMATTFRWRILNERGTFASVHRVRDLDAWLLVPEKSRSNGNLGFLPMAVTEKSSPFTMKMKRFLGMPDEWATIDQIFGELGSGF